MNKTRLTLLGFCVILAGCAATTESAPNKKKIDMNRVNAINRQAEFRNIDIIWINPPRKSSDTTSDEEPAATIEPEKGSETEPEEKDNPDRR
jgi:hypothetical protein